jgi:hypothetical protein
VGEALREDCVVVTSGYAYDLHTGEALGELRSPIVCRLLDLRPPRRAPNRITPRSPAPKGPISPFHEALDFVVEVLVAAPQLEGRFLNGDMLKFRKVTPLELLAAQGE